MQLRDSLNFKLNTTNIQLFHQISLFVDGQFFKVDLAKGKKEQKPS